jgi:hypothetical protein
MSSYPSRCQHIKINGTQCGSPALRRNKHCFFHKRWHEQRVVINNAQARRARSIDLPVLEDADSIQVALMQIMRMIMSGQLDNKKAGLLLYALQTASANLRHTNFEPNLHNIVLDPRDAADSVLGQSRLWSYKDFDDEEDEEEDVQEEDSVELNAVAETDAIAGEDETVSVAPTQEKARCMRRPSQSRSVASKPRRQEWSNPARKPPHPEIVVNSPLKQTARLTRPPDPRRDLSRPVSSDSRRDLSRRVSSDPRPDFSPPAFREPRRRPAARECAIS